MSMSRKDFELVADAINALYRPASIAARSTLDVLVTSLAREFDQAYPNFDPDRFRQAATSTETVPLIVIVADVARAGHSYNGNPTWLITTLAGAQYRTVPDASFGYVVGDHMIGKRWEFTVDSRRRIVDGKEVSQ